MTEELMYQILTGPVAALGLCVITLYALAKWAGKNVPVWVNRHMDQIDKIVDSHNQDREMYRESLGTLTVSLQELNKEVDVIKDDVKDIKHSIKSSQ